MVLWEVGIGGGVRTYKTSLGTSCKAHLGINGLRLYTCRVANVEDAIAHHIILVQICNALAAAIAVKPLIWEAPGEILQICEGVLSRNESSEKDLGLRVFIYMRGGQWIARNSFIVSQTMTLEDALVVHSRLLRARQTSWESLRAEWLTLLQSKSHSLMKCRPLAEVKAMVDKARCVALARHLKQVVNLAERALSHAELQANKAFKAGQRMVLENKAKKASALRQAARKQRHQLWQRRRLWSGEDLTTEEIL